MQRASNTKEASTPVEAATAAAETARIKERKQRIKCL
jgi:hypothetical protein